MQLKKLIHTVDQTILHLEGVIEMSQDQFFDGFSEEKQKQYEQEIRERYGDEAFEGVKDWNSYSKAQQEQIKAESTAIYQDIVVNMSKGPNSPEIQRIVARWHNHLRYFYEPSIERLRGLADLYNDHPGFLKTFQKIHPDLAPFMKSAINFYCDHLK